MSDIELPVCSRCNKRIRFKSQVASRNPYRCTDCREQLGPMTVGWYKERKKPVQQAIDYSPIVIDWSEGISFDELKLQLFKKVFQRYHNNEARMSREIGPVPATIRKWKRINDAN